MLNNDVSLYSMQFLELSLNKRLPYPSLEWPGYHTHTPSDPKHWINVLKRLLLLPWSRIPLTIGDDAGLEESLVQCTCAGTVVATHRETAQAQMEALATKLGKVIGHGGTVSSQRLATAEFAQQTNCVAKDILAGIDKVDTDKLIGRGDLDLLTREL